MQLCQKFHVSGSLCQIGGLVLVRDEELKRSKWDEANSLNYAALLKGQFQDTILVEIEGLTRKRNDNILLLPVSPLP